VTTMLDTLFGLVPEGSRGEQWLAGELQLVNWGGYDGGPHRVRFSPTATLLCGGSGSGKSTLMDAYIALMMPHTTPFNGASNGGVTGRPRGDAQRNILSYGRGKLDESRTDDGTRMRVLRGDGCDTWTAVAMTWVDNSAGGAGGAGAADRPAFTAVRAWYIPAGARVLDDVVRVRAVVDGPFDLGALEAAAAHRLSDATVRATGLETFATDREFLARVQSVLGIGAAGGGAKAMSLLARIQAGQQITTVDELYKRMVLDVPTTMATAEEVVAHFDELEATRGRMVQAQRQVRTLRPIRGIRETAQAAAEQLRLAEEVGRFSDPASPAALWRTGRRLELLRAAEADVRAEARRAGAEAEAHTVAAQAAAAERDGVREVLRNSGGDTLETAGREQAHAERRLAEVRRAREQFDEAVSALGDAGAVTSAAEFAELRAQAEQDEQAEQAQSGGDAPADRGSVYEAYAEAHGAVTRQRKRLAEAESELRGAGSRHGNIPNPLHQARVALAEAAGMTVADLPFVGELVEVQADHEQWREAANLALGGFATTVLLDVDDLPRFRAAVNSVRTGTRIRFEGVPTGTAARRAGDLDPATLPGRLDYRDSPFTGWLQDRLERSFGFVCVDSPDQLRDHDQALTVTGQMSQGRRGAHGGQGRRNVLGFSAAHREAELAAEIGELRARLAEAEAAKEQASARLAALSDRQAAYRRVAEVSWEQIDVATAEQEHRRWSDIITEVTDGNPEIDRLQERISDLEATVTGSTGEAAVARSAHAAATERWNSLVDEVDATAAALDEAAAEGREVTAEQARYLADRVGAGPDDAADLATFDAALAAASRRLDEERLAAQETLGDQHRQLARILESFLDQWPNPNLRADPETSLDDFERLLDDLENSGLHELEAEWKSSLLTLSGNDLTNLDSTLAQARREIRERIEPINRIMADLPFYDDDHRLQIRARDTRSTVRSRFLTELRAVRGLIDEATTDTERGRAYDRMTRLIDRIRPNAPDVGSLIDVRNHVRVSAEKIDAATGDHVSLYDHIGEKSGGESQELIAFIVGAALRYQLGDAGAERPRYAPVFLDEALIKADAHFTARAIGAWLGLGFQLVIGAPNDKYSAIEPHVEVEYDILKDVNGRSWARPKVALPVE
jgi:uncharacterized protein YPO0396